MGLRAGGEREQEPGIRQEMGRGGGQLVECHCSEDAGIKAPGGLSRTKANTEVPAAPTEPRTPRPRPGIRAPGPAGDPGCGGAMAKSQRLLWLLLLSTLCGAGAGESPQPLLSSLSPGARCGGGFPSASSAPSSGPEPGVSPSPQELRKLRL